MELDDELAMLLEKIQQPLEKATRESAVLELFRRDVISYAGCVPGSRKTRSLRPRPSGR